MQTGHCSTQVGGTNNAIDKKKKRKNLLPLVDQKNASKYHFTLTTEASNCFEQINMKNYKYKNNKDMRNESVSMKV